MGSLIMHIAASKIVKEKYNLSNRFMAGCIMPDIYAKCGFDRDETHFIDSSKSKLPNISKFIKTHEKELNDEFNLGYLAHLIEDKIWLNNYINKYTETINENLVKFLFDGSIHTMDEFDEIIYKDYDYMDSQICNKYNISIDGYKKNIFEYLEEDKVKDKVDEFLYIHKFDEKRKNFFLTKKDADKFIALSSDQVKIIIKKYI